MLLFLSFSCALIYLFLDCKLAVVIAIKFSKVMCFSRLISQFLLVVVLVVDFYRGFFMKIRKTSFLN